MARSLAMAAAGVLAGCSAAEERAVIPPLDVQLFAVVRLDSSGAVVDATGLSTPSEAPMRVAGRSGEALWLVGWRDENLIREIGPLPGPAELSAPLHRAGQCELALPDPTWIIRADASGEMAGDPAAVGPLTADWLLTRSCPETRISAEVGCAATGLDFCPLREIRQQGCALELPFDCELGMIQARRVGNKLCVQTPGCALREDADGALSGRCKVACKEGQAGCPPNGGVKECQLRLVVDPPEPNLQIDHLKLVSDPLKLPPDGMFGELRHAAVDSGYLGPILRLGERIVVVVSRWHDDACGGEGQIQFVDPTAMTIVSTATSPACLTHLMAERGGRSMIGLFQVGGHPRIGRFNASGRLIASRELSSEPLTPGGLTMNDTRIWAAAYLPMIPTPTTHLYELDPVSLETLASWTHIETQAIALAVTEDPWLLVLDDANDYVTWFPVGLANCISNLSVHLLKEPLIDLGSVPSLALYYSSSPRREVIVAINEAPALHVEDDLCRIPPIVGCFDPGGFGLCTAGTRAVFTQWGGEPVRIGDWSRRRGLAVAGAARPARLAWTFEAVLGLYDPAARRFASDVAKLGPGIARDLTEDAQGRLWVELPWSGELVRVDVN